MKNSELTRVISFSSGKGGVGKTNTVLNIAYALAERGKSVLILDGDLGLANINVLLGMRPTFTLADFFDGLRPLTQVIEIGPMGISIIPAASGVQSLCSLTTSQRYMLIQAVESVAYQYDYLLIDTQAGIGPEVLHFNSASSEMCCIINAEPTSLTDAYALIKVMSQSYGQKEVQVIVNNVTSEQEARTAFNRISQAVDRFLHVKLRLVGIVPHDSAVREAVTRQRALMEIFPTSKAAQAISIITDRIEADFHSARVKGGLQFFFKQLLEVSAGG